MTVDQPRPDPDARVADPARHLRASIALPGGIAPLGHRNFALFWLGFLCSNTGRWIEITGVVWIMYELTGSPVLLGLLGVCRAVPNLVLSPIAGVIADRVDQRRLLIAVQALGLLSSLTIGLLVLTGLVQFWHFYVQVVLQSSVAAFEAALRFSLFPRLVPRGQLDGAVVLIAAAARTSALLGPAIGGLAIARLGVAAPFLIYVALFLLMMGAVAGVRGVRPRSATPGSTFRGELVDGLRYILNAPVLSGLLKLEIIFGIFSMNPVMITLIGREVLRAGPEALGGLLSAPALGGLLGIAWALVLGRPQRPGRFVYLSSYAYAAALIAFALSDLYLTSFALLVIIGLLDSFVAVTRQTVMQLAAPPRMRGRVMGNVAMVTRGTGPLAQVQSGSLTAAIGAPFALFAAAGVLVVAASVGSITNRELWTYRRERDDTSSLPTDVRPDT